MTKRPKSKHRQMRDAIDAVELALNELRVDDIVRKGEGAADTAYVRVSLGQLRRLASCYPELNRIVNDPVFEKP